MSYLVLARKYRPQRFEDVVGQDHITKILKKAITSSRIAQAYLFTGPRGIGKTSCARIFAMCLNDEKGPTITPDLKSSIAQEIAKGNSLDVIEIDGASNRGIDEIRTLRENVKFAPSYGRFKIYIVDEVHMLTMEAFNALLKTLEEPPEHVKFIFATTNPQKIPSTIISRCQRFDFKRISLETIIETLKSVSKQEKLKIDVQAHFVIAKAAQGSMRDALSILDQLSSLADEGVEAEEVTKMLGLVETQLLFDIADAIAKKSCADCLKILDSIVNHGKDVKQLVKDLTEHFRHLMVIKVGGKALGKLVDYPIHLKEMILTQCQQFELKDILTIIDMLIETQQTFRITESVQMPLEVAFAKLTYQTETQGEAQLTSLPDHVSEESATVHKRINAVEVLKSEKGELSFSKESDTEDNNDSTPEGGEQKQEEHQQEGFADNAAIDIDQIRRNWDAITYAVSRQKMSLATYLQDALPLKFDGEKLVIGFPEGFNFQKETLEENNNIRMINTELTKYFKKTICAKFVLDDTQRPKTEEPNVKSVIDKFEGSRAGKI